MKFDFVHSAILQKAIDHFGEKNQTAMAMEEALELALAIRKLLRNGTVTVVTMEPVASEIADTLIMIQQLYMMYPGLESQVHYIAEQKIHRLSINLSLLKQKDDEK